MQQMQQDHHTQNLPIRQKQQQQQQQIIYTKKIQLQKEQRQQRKPKTQKRSLYLGNLGIGVTENDIYDFFELRSIKYIQETLDFPLSKKKE